MPVEGNVYAALVTELEKRLQVDGKSQFLSHPQFLVRLGLNDLLFEAHAVQERTGLDELQASQEAVKNREVFAMIANPIFEASRTFLPDSRMLWSIYEQVIEAPELPVGAVDNEAVVRTALLFPALRVNFELAERGWGYYDTGVLPPSDVTDSDGWTRIVLDRQLIDDRSQQSSPATRAWLEQRGLLDPFAGTGVRGTTLSAEIFLLTLQRTWFEPEVFRNRLWRWDDAPLSDGGNPPQGLLPAYVTRLVLVRKLQMELDFASDAILGFDFTPGPSSSATSVPAGAAAFSSMPANTNAAPQPLPLLAHTPDPNKALSLRQFARATTDENPGPNALAFAPLSNQTVGFPAPVTFLTRRVIDRIAAEEKLLGIQLAAWTAQLIERQEGLRVNDIVIAKLQHQLDSYPPGAETITTITGDVTDVAALREYIADAKRDQETERAMTERQAQTVAELNQHARYLQDLRQYYESLSPAGDDSDMFVLGFVCSATPKSPDPDPAFFT
jgi:hypothetical protein